MFLIDSSAWIEYFRPDGSKKIKERVKEILQRDEAVTCGVVIVEILRGAKDERSFQTLRDSLFSLPQIPTDSAVIERAAEWGFRLDRKGKIVPTTDLFIASASYKRAKLLHLDSDFEVIASHFDLEQEKL
ncbi:MAG: PIN domain nuclease [Nitrospirota bacterium]